MPVPVGICLIIFFFKIDNITLDMDPDPNWAKILDPNLDIKKTYHPKRAACRDWWLEGRSSRLPRRDLCKNVFSPIIILVKIALINKFDQTFRVIMQVGARKIRLFQLWAFSKEPVQVRKLWNRPEFAIKIPDTHTKIVIGEKPDKWKKIVLNFCFTIFVTF